MEIIFLMEFGLSEVDEFNLKLNETLFDFKSF